MTEQNLQQLDVIQVERDGERLDVYNWVTVMCPRRLRGDLSTEYFEPTVRAGDSQRPPEHVTHWVAEAVYEESLTDVTDLDIEVVDVTDDEVTVL